MVSPFCHEQQEGAHEVRGWCLDTPGHAPGSALPINCSLFDGLTIVRCDCCDSEILELLSNSEDTRRRLGAAIDRIMQTSLVDDDMRASWKRCRPTANGIPRSLCSAAIVTESSVKKGGQVSFFNSEDCVPLIDSEPWKPELSPEGFLGLYHHWNYEESRSPLYHGHSQGRSCKGPSLYMVCQSYLPKACLEFADMVRDLGDACTASEIYHSEEAFWLRQACSRNRRRLIALVCHEMGIKCPLMLDYNACKADVAPILLAMPSIETLHHDMQCLSSRSLGAGEAEVIRILNFCSSGPNASCVMAPWDGLWVFHGGGGHAGGALGSTFSPTITPQIGEQDYWELKQKKQSDQVLFTSKIPQSCEVLHVFCKKSTEKHAKRKKKGSRSAKSFLPSQEDNDDALTLLGSLDALQYQGGDLELLAVPPSATIKVVNDPDVLAAYQRSIAKMASLVLENQKNTGPTTAGDLKKGKKKTFLTFNEHVLQAMEQQGWKRSNGYTVLIPLACGLCEHWRQKWEDGAL